jgi:hypothetical protein
LSNVYFMTFDLLPSRKIAEKSRTGISHGSGKD